MKISKTIKYKNGNYRTGTLLIVELSPSCVNAYIAYLIVSLQELLWWWWQGPCSEGQGRNQKRVWETRTCNVCINM